MNTPLLPLTPNREATLREYIDMRDCAWRLLKRPENLTSGGLEHLELCNNVVRLLLRTQHESLNCVLELLQCDACEIFIARGRREIRAEDRQSPFPVDLRTARQLLEIALEKDTEVIPEPAPSSALPIQAS